MNKLTKNTLEDLIKLNSSIIGIATLRDDDSIFNDLDPKPIDIILSLLRLDNDKFEYEENEDREFVNDLLDSVYLQKMEVSEAINQLDYYREMGFSPWGY
jgi:ABC-type lipopolysaccharide export system ATPase subunit